MLGGEVGKSAMLKRPGTAWKTLIHTVDAGGIASCRALMMCGKACPLGDGQGRACERILIELFDPVTAPRSATKIKSAASGKAVCRSSY